MTYEQAVEVKEVLAAILRGTDPTDVIDEGLKKFYHKRRARTHSIKLARFMVKGRKLLKPYGTYENAPPRVQKKLKKLESDFQRTLKKSKTHLKKSDQWPKT